MKASSWVVYKKFKDKLVRLGTELSHKRHKILLGQCNCPRCNHFFSDWAANSFRPDKKPRKCLHCRLENPLRDVVDPLDAMLEKKGKVVGAMMPQL